MRRYVSLLAGVIVQIALGGIYAFSTYVPSLHTQWGFSSTQTQSVFGLTIFLFTLYMIYAGKKLSIYGTRRLILISGVLFLLGHFAASFSGGSFILFLLSYLLLIAPALSFGYVCPVSSGVLWFPNHRGFVTGLSVAGYGIGGVVLSTVVEALLGAGWSIEVILRFVGTIWGIVIIICGLISSTPPGLIHDEEKRGEVSPIKEHRKEFLGLTMFILFGTLPGLMLIGALKPFGLFNQVSPPIAALGVSILSIGNGAGRITWGFLADRISPRRVALINLTGVVISVIMLFLVEGHHLFFIPAGFVLGFCYGGPLVIVPDQIGRVFGSRNLSRVYPTALAFHGLAAAVGASLAGLLVQVTGVYSGVIIIAGFGSILGLGGYYFLLKGTEKL